MKTYNVVLTEEQREALLQIAKVEWDYGEGTATEHVAIFGALYQAQPIQEKVWLPFTELKDGGTYMTRLGVEHAVYLRPLGKDLTYPYGSHKDNTCWTLYGNYDSTGGYSSHGLTLELQPYKEQTTV